MPLIYTFLFGFKSKVYTSVLALELKVKVLRLSVSRASHWVQYLKIEENIGIFYIKNGTLSLNSGTEVSWVYIQGLRNTDDNHILRTFGMMNDIGSVSAQAMMFSGLAFLMTFETISSTLFHNEFPLSYFRRP